MAKIRFLGGDETGNVGSVQWGKHKFELNKSVECDDPHIVRKARANRFFEVSDDKTPDVAIPADWEKLTAAEKVDLVHQLGNEGVSTGKEADVVIVAELDRRARVAKKAKSA